MEKFIDRQLIVLQKKPAPLKITLIASIVFVIGILDYVTRFEMAIYLFYIVPVGLATWIIDKRAGILISFLITILWLITNKLGGNKFSHELVYYCNALFRFVLFLMITMRTSSLRKTIEREKQLARTDTLTGALNRRAFYEITENSLSNSFLQPITIVYIDLDNFKRINDELGHHIGDTLLKQVVKVIHFNIRSTDLLARFGGDEFVILLPQTNADSAKLIVSRLQRELLKEMQKQQWAVTFSMGVLTYLHCLDNIENIIKLADTLMYEVKTSSKNSVRYHICGKT